MGIKGLSLLEEEKKSIQEEEVSGLILFKRNIKSLPQLFALCREIHSLNPTPLIMMDREGGEVDRLRHLREYPPWPGLTALTQVASLSEIEKTAFYMAQELKALGVCASFSPLVDVPSALNPLFKGRLLGNTPQEITNRAFAYLKGIKKAGLASSVKHFPGHGGVLEDSHLCLPVDKRAFESLKKKDLIPFKKAIEFKVEIIMTAHVLYSQVDSYPATLSEIFLKKVLRKKMKFAGLTLSDDLDMKALSDRAQEQVMALALKAGVDILLKCAPVENLKELLHKTQMILEREETEQRSKQKPDLNFLISKKLFRLQRFKQKYKQLKPVSSFEVLKNLTQDLKVRKWCETLNKRIRN